MSTQTSHCIFNNHDTLDVPIKVELSNKGTKLGVFEKGRNGLFLENGGIFHNKRFSIFRPACNGRIATINHGIGFWRGRKGECVSKQKDKKKLKNQRLLPLRRRRQATVWSHFHGFTQTKQLRFYPHHSDIKWHSLLAFRPLTHHFLLDKAIPRRITRDANDSA